MLAALWQPFAEFAFCSGRCWAGGAGVQRGPLGVFLMLRRMSLIGDAISHGVLPGAALAFWFFGLSLPALTFGGLVAGLGMAGLAAWITRRTGLREDASLAAIYPISLAGGVLLLGLAGRRIDLLHLLFGSALAVDGETLRSMLTVAGTSLALLALIYRPLLWDSFDPVFLRGVSRFGAPAYALFLALVVLNLVTGFHAIGALMVVGLMMLPAAAALEPAPAGAAADGGGHRRELRVAGAVAVVPRQPAQRALHCVAGGARLPDFGVRRAGPRLAATRAPSRALLRSPACSCACALCCCCACPFHCPLRRRRGW